MTTIQGFTPPPNHVTMGVESTILDNLTPAPSDMSGQGEPDMSAKLKQRAVINGKVFWLTGSTQQELFQSYLSHAITDKKSAEIPKFRHFDMNKTILW